MSMSDLTEELILQVCGSIRNGNFRTIAFDRYGIPRGTWAGWIDAGHKQLREHAAGERKDEDMDRRAKLCLALNKVEAELHDELIVDVLENGSPELVMKFMRYRWNKLYNNNPNATDDATGEDVKRNALDILIGKLATFVEDDED
jgi:hypothetical protein